MNSYKNDKSHHNNMNNNYYNEQAQLRSCKLGPGTVFLIMFFSEIKFLSVALLSQARKSECGMAHNT